MKLNKIVKKNVVKINDAELAANKAVSDHLKEYSPYYGNNPSEKKSEFLSSLSHEEREKIYCEWSKLAGLLD